MSCKTGNKKTHTYLSVTCIDQRQISINKYIIYIYIYETGRTGITSIGSVTSIYILFFVNVVRVMHVGCWRIMRNPIIII